MTLPEPRTCERCDGDGVIEHRGGLHPCPDCRCVVCGDPAVGMCQDCEDDDFVNVDTAHRRSTDV